ncbi:MAG: hypothetical protein ACKVVP_14545 [Chloroflexota bacterium]
MALIDALLSFDYFTPDEAAPRASPYSGVRKSGGVASGALKLSESDSSWGSLDAEKSRPGSSQRTAGVVGAAL